MERPQLAELERVQTGILNGISNIDLSLLSPNNDLSAASNDVMASPKLGYPSPDYYDRHIKSRLDNLSAASIHHRYKSVVLVYFIDCFYLFIIDNDGMGTYFCAISAHAVGFNVEAVINYLCALNGGKISKKKINLRLTPEETSAKLILNPDIFWLGGREVSLKLAISTLEFIDFVKPSMASCSGS
ncbi:YbaK/aminoacyl-tRNA synthetase-associated domain [Salix suchowensis]|nr:YbaK/aminoacyl-tRNA synthetase-associated domain [Salix suchowensis]